jgi:DNA-binding MarR family transcriptional regulator
MSTTASGTASTGTHHDLAGELLEAARSVVRAASRAAGPGRRQELTGAQMDVLVHVRRNPDCSVADVATSLQLARNTVSTLVGQLTQSDLLERAADAQDGRVTRLRLQPEAEHRMAAWRARRVDAVSAALQLLDDDERGQILAALPALRHAGRALEERARREGGVSR